MHLRDISEDQIILAHTLEWMTESGINKQRFSQEHLLPSLQRAELLTEEPALIASYERWFDSRRKIISGILSGKQPMPLSWKWPWVCALPEDHQRRCRASLMSVQNCFFLELPSGDEVRMPTKSTLAELTREFSEVISASRPAQDGMLDSRDDTADLRDYAGQLLDLIERAAQELVNIQVGTGVVSARQLRAWLHNRLENNN